MATEQERVVLTVEARDQLTAPLQAMQRSLDATAAATTASAQRQAAGIQRAMAQVQGAQSRTTAGSTVMERAMARTSRTVATDMDNAARRIDQRFVGAITTGFSRLRGAITSNSAQIISTVDNVASRATAAGAAIGEGLKNGAINAGKAVGVAAGLVGGVVAKAISGGLNRQMNIEDAQAKLVGLGSSAKDVTKIMESAMDSVKGTSFGMDSAATIAATAVASGIKPGKDLTKYLTLVGDASTIAGVGLDEMGQIMGKVTNAGKVTNEVVQQFGDRGVGVLQMLAKEYGVTADEMTSMISKGKVDSKTFEKVLTENIGGAALKSGNTTRGALANMGAALSRVGVTLTMGFFPLMAKGYNAITETLDGMNKKIKPAGEAFAKWFGDKATPVLENFSKNALAAFQEVIGSVYAFRAAFTASEDDITSSGLPGFMEHVGNAARKVKDGVVKMNPHMETLRTTLVPLAAVFLSMSANALTFIPILGKFLPVISPVVAIIAGLIIASPELRAALVGTFEALVPVLGSIATAMAPVMIVFAQVVAQAALFAAWIIEKLNPALPVLVPLLLGVVLAVKAYNTAMVVGRLVMVAWGIATSVVTGIQLGYQAAMGRSAYSTSLLASRADRAKLALIAMKATQYAVTAATWVAAGAQWAWNAAMNANPIGLIVMGIAALVAGVIWAYNNIGWFKDGVDAAMKWIQEAFANVVDWWNANLMPAISAVGEWFGDMVTVVQDVIGNVVAWAKDHWGLLLSFLIGPLGLVIQWVVEHWSEITTVVTDVWNNVVKFTQDFAAGVMSVLGTIGQWFVDTFGPAVRMVGDVFAAVFGWVQRFVWNAMTIVMAIFYKLVDLWNGVLKPALDMLAGWFTSIMAAIGEKIAFAVEVWKLAFAIIVDWWNTNLVPVFEAVGLAFEIIMGWIGEKIGLAVLVWQYAFGVIVEWWNTTLLPAVANLQLGIETIMGWISEKITLAVLVWQYAFAVIVDWWNTTLIPAVQAIGNWFGSVFSWIQDNVIAPAVAFITTKFAELISWWNTNLQPVINAVAGWFRDKIGGAIDNVIGHIDNVKTGFNGFIAFWTDKLKPVVDSVTSAFEAMGNIIGGAVAGIKEFAANPLGGIQDWLGVEKDGNGQGVMPSRNSGGGVYPGNGVHFAGGGVLGGYAPGVDSIPAWLSPGESVLVPELTRALGPSNIMAANHAASGGRRAGSGPARATTVTPTPPAGGGGGNQTIVKIEAGAITMAFEGGDATQLTGADIQAALEDALREILERGY